MSNPETMNWKYRLDFFNWKISWSGNVGYARCVSSLLTTGRETSTTTAFLTGYRNDHWPHMINYQDNYADNNFTQSALTPSARHGICKSAKTRQVVSILFNWPSTSLWRPYIKVGLPESHIMGSMSRFRSMDKFQHDTSGRARARAPARMLSNRTLRVDLLPIEPVTSHPCQMLKLERACL